MLVAVWEVMDLGLRGYMKHWILMDQYWILAADLVLDGIISSLSSTGISANAFISIILSGVILFPGSLLVLRGCYCLMIHGLRLQGW